MAPKDITSFVNSSVSTGLQNGSIKYSINYAPLSSGAYATTSFDAATSTVNILVSSVLDPVQTGLTFVHEIHHAIQLSTDGSALGGFLVLDPNSPDASIYGKTMSLDEAPAYAAEFGMMPAAIRDYLSKGNTDAAIALVTTFNKVLGPQYLAIRDLTVDSLVQLLGIVNSLSGSGHISSDGRVISNANASLVFSPATGSAPAGLALFQYSGTTSQMVWHQFVLSGLNPIAAGVSATTSALASRFTAANVAIGQLPMQNDITALSARLGSQISAINGNSISRPNVTVPGPDLTNFVVPGGSVIGNIQIPVDTSFPPSELQAPFGGTYSTTGGVRVFNLDENGNKVSEIVGCDSQGNGCQIIPFENGQAPTGAEPPPAITNSPALQVGGACGPTMCEYSTSGLPNFEIGSENTIGGIGSTTSGGGGGGGGFYYPAEEN